MENKRPVRTLRPILPNSSKILEHCMCDKYFDKILSKCKVGFSCLLAMIKKLRKFLESEGVSGALLANISTAFNCMLHEFLIER